MSDEPAPGQIVILNGAPRAGKSSIVSVMQDTFDGVWMNLGVDVFARGVTPKRYQPGVGLRPGRGPGLGGDNSELEALLPAMYAALFDSIAAHSRLGLNVVFEGGLHGAIHPGLPADCARRLVGLPVLFVGVRCPVDVVLQRRRDSASGSYVTSAPGEPIPPAVLLWEQEVHKIGAYDLEVDTSLLGSEECAEEIRRRLAEGPPGAAFAQLAERG